MKRVVILVALLCLEAGTRKLEAGSWKQEAAPGRYLVATRSPAPRTITIRTTGGAIERHVTQFRCVNGFAASLTDDEVEALRRSPDVRWIEPDRELHQFEQPPGSRMQTLSPNDPQITPWGVDAVRAFAVWGVTRGEGIKVAVIDSGIDLAHPDLVANYRGGRDFVDNDDTPEDGNGHGTHVAGIIAAADNGVGTIGVAPNAQLYALRVLGNDGNGSTSAEIEAVDWAIANHIQVMNLSLGSSTASDLEKEAFDRAADAGVLAVAATGNDGSSAVSYPAAYSSVVAVGAIDGTLRPASFSNVGDEVDLAAPGVRIESTVPQGSGLLARVTIGDGRAIDATTLEHSAHATVTGSFVYCGFGRAEDLPSNVSGNIALIRRGEIPFADKTKNAMNAGATAVVIFDNVLNGDSSGWTLGDEAVAWPLVLGISKENGETLLLTTNTVITADASPGDYGYKSGTSMAAPHVAGVAALVWSLDPGSTAEQVRQAMLTTSRDLGSAGFDPFFGNGLVDAEAAGKSIAPQRFPSRSLHMRRSR